MIVNKISINTFKTTSFTRMNEDRLAQDNMTPPPFEPNMKEIIKNTLNNLGYKKDKDTMSFQVLKAYENREYHNIDHLKNMFTNLRA